MNPRSRIHLSPFVSLSLTTLAYALSGAVVGLSAFPSALLLRWAARELLAPAGTGRLLLFCVLAGAGLYLFFVAGVLVTGILLRCVSTAIRPGMHRLLSVTGMWWMGMNGLQTIATRLLLRAVPGGWLPHLYYRLAGCRMGRDVWIIGAVIIDPHLVSIGDGTVIGGEAVISPHLASGASVYFGPITIGHDCRIGAHSVICAGTVIGDGATVGIHAYLRKGTRVPAGGHVAAPGALQPRDALALEQGTRTRGPAREKRPFRP